MSLVNDPNGNYSLMLDWTQERIYAVTDQAQYFAARVAFVQDEVFFDFSVLMHRNLPISCFSVIRSINYSSQLLIGRARCFSFKLLVSKSITQLVVLNYDKFVQLTCTCE